jgi:prepilin-type N-terminal cleavage/methylation domain-containing protein/prepilin-type processing-associated H-X9-DG protein
MWVEYRRDWKEIDVCGLDTSRSVLPGGRRRGFTLIELLVVIAIVALLMAILVPVLRRVRSQARAVICQSNVHQWALICCAYTDDYDGKWCYFKTEGNERYWSSVKPDELWFRQMWSYWFDGDREIILCPEAPEHKECDDPPQGWGATFSAWRERPLVEGYDGIERESIDGSYGLNHWLYDAGSDRRIIRPELHSAHELWGTTRVKNAGSVPVLCDCALMYSGVGDYWEPPCVEDLSRMRGMNGESINRHNGGINMLFMDCSVRKVGIKEVATLKWHRYFNAANKWTKAGGVRSEDWPEWMRGFRDY